jgi:hypothetical protein
MIGEYVTVIAAGSTKGACFRYAESHSGGPCHRLQQSGEWQCGIGKVLERGDDGDHPYLGVARQHVDKLRYPAGWVFFACALAARVTRLSVNLCDLSSDVAGQYSSLPADLYPDNVSVEFRRVDGYSHLDCVQGPSSLRSVERWRVIARSLAAGKHVAI